MHKSGPRQDSAAAPNAPEKRVEHLAGHNWLVRARHGIYLANQNDVYIGQALIRYGEYSELEWLLLERYCREGGVVVEVGTNIGAHTVSFAKAVGPSGRVVAVEPQPVIFRDLCANLGLNGLANVDVHNCGCGSREGSLSVPATDYGVPGNFGGIALRESSNGVAGTPVRIVTLDALLSSAARVDLIKIDVEGMENDVLAGGRQVIDTFRPVLYVENDRVEKSKPLLETLIAMGYRMWWHVPPLYNPDNFYGNSENAFPGVGSFNMLCLHPSKADAAPDGLQEITDPDRHLLSPAAR